DSCVCHDTPRPDLYTLSLPDALPIFLAADDREHRRPVRLELGRTDAPEEPELAQVLGPGLGDGREGGVVQDGVRRLAHRRGHLRSEEHTSELQSRENLVCCLLLVKKK